MPNSSARPTRCCAPTPAGVPTTPTSTASRARWVPTLEGNASELERAAVLGSGGTAPAALVGLVELGAADVSIVSRNRDKAEPLLALGARLGVAVRWVALGTPLGDVDAVVNTLPASVAAEHAATVAAGVALLLDAIYDPWPTPLAEVVAAAGGSGGQRAGHAAASGLRPSGAVHRAAGAERGDERGAGLTLAFEDGGGGGLRVRAGLVRGADGVRRPAAAATQRADLARRRGGACRRGAHRSRRACGPRSSSPWCCCISACIW